MEDDDFISKSARKRQMTELQVAGAALVKLSREQIERLDIPEALREAVLECKRFNKHEAIRRQMQFIGRIMRKYDAGPIVAQLSAIEAPSRRQTALLHLAERWRGEMMSDPQAIVRFAQEFPAADPERLRELVSRARKEKEGDRAPKNFREIFHVVNALLQEHARRNP